MRVYSVNMVDRDSRKGDTPASLGSSLDVLTQLQKKAFKTFPYERNARRQLFIENAPTDMLQFCVSHYEKGTENERQVIRYAVNRYFGFSDRKCSEWQEQRDADFCEAFQNCFDLVAVAAPYLPLRLEAAVDLLDSMSENMRSYGIPCTRENQRARYLVNVITYTLPSRTIIKEGYRSAILASRESIEKNLDVILGRKLFQMKDIRTITEAHPALVSGAL
jgi:hypothetical protein